MDVGLEFRFSVSFECGCYGCSDFGVSCRLEVFQRVGQWVSRGDAILGSLS